MSLIEKQREPGTRQVAISRISRIHQVASLATKARKGHHLEAATIYRYILNRGLKQAELKTIKNQVQQTIKDIVFVSSTHPTIRYKRKTPFRK